MQFKGYYILLILFVGYVAPIKAQSISFFKKDGKRTTKDSAYYTRTITPLDPTSALFSVVEYYYNGVKKMTGVTSQPNTLVLEGLCTTYYPNGNKFTAANFTKSMNLGADTTYYPNGKLYCTQNYIKLTAAEIKAGLFSAVIESCYDSLGKALVVNGNGNYIVFDGFSEFKRISEQGPVKDGKRNGQWNGAEYYHDTLNLKYTETYEDGKFISGRSVDGKGYVNNYTVANVNPQFEGGEDQFYKFLGHNIRYPKLAKENNIQGKVYISFVIEKDGQLADIKIVREPGGGLGDESVRVLKLSPPWSPGFQHGRPVRVSYTVPINFALGNR